MIWQGKVVVVCEDEPALAKMAQRFLESHGATVHVAHDGESGLDLIRHVVPDHVVLDLIMPRMDGLEVLKTIRSDAALQNLPVTVTSTQTDDCPAYHQCQELANRYLIKPYDPRELTPL
ncbi:MAG: response regulator [Chthonomonas sp.]|nr:response regulator [Chthonomonas sp.]